MTILSIILFLVGGLMIIGSFAALKDAPKIIHANEKDKGSDAMKTIFIGILVCLVGWWVWPSTNVKDLQKVTETENTNQAPNKAVSESATTQYSLGQKLCLMDKHKLLPLDDEYVVRTTNLLELLSNKYHEPMDTIADWSERARGALHEKGIEDYNLNILLEINKIPKMDNTKFKDVAALYAMTRTVQDN